MCIADFVPQTAEYLSRHGLFIVLNDHTPFTHGSEPRIRGILKFGMSSRSSRLKLSSRTASRVERKKKAIT